MDSKWIQNGFKMDSKWSQIINNAIIKKNRRMNFIYKNYWCRIFDKRLFYYAKCSIRRTNIFGQTHGTLQSGCKMMFCHQHNAFAMNFNVVPLLFHELIHIQFLKIFGMKMLDLSMKNICYIVIPFAIAIAILSKFLTTLISLIATRNKYFYTLLEAESRERVRSDRNYV